MFQDATQEEIDHAMRRATDAAVIYGQMPFAMRKKFMYAIADALEAKTGDLCERAMQETNLPERRLHHELQRTAFQMRSYGDAAEQALWMDIRIDTADGKQIKSDIRKMQIPLGPVLVFGASNFPFAYSTAGGDTACAFAAGCPVIVKAHPAHARTSQLVADIISGVARQLKLPDGVFSHLHGVSFDVSKALVMHPDTRAVGFTGSFAGGKQLFDWGNERSNPIPVFCEMGSTNPVFLLPGALEANFASLASKYAHSITTNAGQFCTKPGLIVAVDGEGSDQFAEALQSEIKKIAPQKMLHGGIASSYGKLKAQVMNQSNVRQVATTSVDNEIHEGVPFIAAVRASDFIANDVLRQEVFGPFSLLILCADTREMQAVAEALDGQLTATIIGTENELQKHIDLIYRLQQICGRLVMNGVPTGVSVGWAMHHGGPFPATTDARFTSVGPDGIRRFARPLTYQDWPDSLLPDALKNENPLGLWRMVNGSLSDRSIGK